MRVLLLLLPLAACAAPACKPAAMTAAAPQVEVIEKVIIVRDRPVHEALLTDYAQTLRAEKPLVLKDKAPVIDELITLDAAARVAFAPIESPNHRATPEEVAKAVAALGAVQAYVSQKH